MKNIGTECRWFVGNHPERFHIECASREDAVKFAKANGGAYVIEASNPSSIALSDYFDAHDFMEGAEEAAWHEHGYCEDDCPVFDLTPDQLNDLKATVRAAIDTWQKRHDLTFTSHKSPDVQHPEFIPADTDEPS